MTDFVLYYEVNSRGNFHWNASYNPMMQIVDPVRKLKLVELSYLGSFKRPKKRDTVKRIWVKRGKNNKLYISPEVKPKWESL